MTKKQSTAAIKRWQNPEYQESQRVAREELHSDPIRHEKQRSGLKRIREDPELLKMRIESQKATYVNHPEKREEKSKQSKKMWKKPGYRENVINKMKMALSTPEARQKQSDVMIEICKRPEIKKIKIDTAKKNWENPEYRKNKTNQVIKMWQDPDVRKKISEGIKLAYKNEDLLTKKSETSKKMWEDPEYRKRMSIISMTIREAPGYKETMSKAQKKKWKNPDTLKKASEASKIKWASPDYHNKMCEIHTERCNDPEYYIHRYNFYYGDVDKYPIIDYDPCFNQKTNKAEILRKFNWKCQFPLEDGTICGKTKAKNVDKHGIHRHPARHHIFPHTTHPYKEENITQVKMNLVRQNLPPEIARFGELNYSDEEKTYIDMQIPLCLLHHHSKEIRNEEKNNIPYHETKYRKLFAEIILTMNTIKDAPET